MAPLAGRADYTSRSVAGSHPSIHLGKSPRETYPATPGMPFASISLTIDSGRLPALTPLKWKEDTRDD